MEQREEVFDRVYRMHGPALYRFCLMQMKNAADAEDVMQEVFVKRLYQAPPFRTPEHERRWLFRVALNQCRDEWKRGCRRELPLEAAALVAATGGSEPIRVYRDNGDSVTVEWLSRRLP